MRITRELMNEFKTARGGFLREVECIFAGTKDLKTGWIERAIGREISAKELILALELNDAHNARQASNHARHFKTWKKHIEPLPFEVAPMADDFSMRRLKPGFAPWEEDCFEITERNG